MGKKIHTSSVAPKSPPPSSSRGDEASPPSSSRRRHDSRLAPPALPSCLAKDIAEFAAPLLHNQQQTGASSSSLDPEINKSVTSPKDKKDKTQSLIPRLRSFLAELYEFQSQIHKDYNHAVQNDDSSIDDEDDEDNEKHDRGEKALKNRSSIMGNLDKINVTHPVFHSQHIWQQLQTRNRVLVSAVEKQVQEMDAILHQQADAVKDNLTDPEDLDHSQNHSAGDQDDSQRNDHPKDENVLSELSDSDDDNDNRQDLNDDLVAQDEDVPLDHKAEKHSKLDKNDAKLDLEEMDFFEQNVEKMMQGQFDDDDDDDDIGDDDDEDDDDDDDDDDIDEPGLEYFNAGMKKSDKNAAVATADADNSSEEPEQYTSKDFFGSNKKMNRFKELDPDGKNINNDNDEQEDDEQENEDKEHDDEQENEDKEHDDEQENPDNEVGGTGVERARSRAELYDSGSESQDYSSSDSAPSDDPGNEREKSRLEIDQAHLQKTIQRLEQKNVKEKPWHLKGEVTANVRPKNSLLEAVLEHDTTHKPDPLITQETTIEIEELIKQRIFDGVFDDVERIIPLEDDIEKKKKKVEEISQEKSKQGLAEIYEQEFLSQMQKVPKKMSSNGNNHDDDDAVNPKHKEIDELFEKLCMKLDRLSNLHYTPNVKNLELEVAGSNVAALVMEEAIPEAVTDATLLAPNEVFSTKDEKGDKEMSKEDRKRKRKLLKQSKKKEKIEKEKRIALREKMDPEFAMKRARERAVENLKSKYSKTRVVLYADKANKEKSKRKSYDRSSSFFTSLQESRDVKKTKHDDKQKANTESAKLKL